MQFFRMNSFQPPQPLKKPVLGELLEDVSLAREKGVRYKKWTETAPFWLANAGITRPYSAFTCKPHVLYHKLLSQSEQNNFPSIFYEYLFSMEEIRKDIKSVFGDCTLLFDSNGSTLISTLAKGVKARRQHEPDSMTFSDTGRLVYSALAFEASSIRQLNTNFEQPLGIFDYPAPEKHPFRQEIPESVRVINIFSHDASGYAPKDDRMLLHELEQMLKTNKKISLFLLLHVSRTGRILPVEDMARLIKSKKPDAYVFVDGCQAVGRLPYEEIKRAFDASDAYVFVGHKALGSMVCGAAALKRGVEEWLFFPAIENDFLFNLRLFQFESERINELVAKKQTEKKLPNYMVSLPEIMSLRLALSHSIENFAKKRPIVEWAKGEILDLLFGFGALHPIGCANQVKDIVSFFTSPPSLARKIKEALQNPPLLCSKNCCLDLPITIAPITDDGAARIAIDAKLERLPEAIGVLKTRIMDILRSSTFT